MSVWDLDKSRRSLMCFLKLWAQTSMMCYWKDSFRSDSSSSSVSALLVLKFLFRISVITFMIIKVRTAVALPHVDIIIISCSYLTLRGSSLSTPTTSTASRPPSPSTTPPTAALPSKYVPYHSGQIHPPDSLPRGTLHRTHSPPFLRHSHHKDQGNKLPSTGTRGFLS